MKFSQRIGKTPTRTVLQVESIDKPLEIRLWNFIAEHFFDIQNGYSDRYEDSDRAKTCKVIWINFFNQLIDDIPRYSNTGTIASESIIDYYKEWFFKAAWYEKYDFLEYLTYLTKENYKPIFIDILNFTLKRELAGYRLINVSALPSTYFIKEA